MTDSSQPVPSSENTPWNSNRDGTSNAPGDTPPELAYTVENCPSKSLHLGRWTVEGYSRAAVQSYWRIPEMRLGFDLGAHPWDYMGLPACFISHTHLDHVAALPVYVARRRMMKMEPPKVFLPGQAVSPVEHLLKVVSRLDRGRLPVELIGLEAGDEVELSRELIVTAHATVHTVTSLGFIVWERRKKLKPEFQGMTGDQIRDIRLSGVEVSAETRLPMVAYTGDTTPEGLDRNPSMYQAEILITEMTFVAPNHRKEKIHKHGHTHLDDIVQRRDRFQNRHIIFGHFSTRYSPAQIQRWVRKAIPDALDGRMRLWV